ncbi:PIG-L family deacetylase [Nonomuraea typhae]|uniref:PIG-L family deacetylase n=1 Tax=Nonomuraea typhae TaxID=2603600 RepID=UPI0012FC742B|nr:PIG-L family deacetylase [Nonomuraea typhae]
MSYRTIVVSPHFDDAALSVAGLLDALPRPAVFVTVFGGAPHADRAPSAWDRLCGFTSAAEAARERRAEDARACELLGVGQLVLDNPDAPANGVRLAGLAEFLTTHAGAATRVLIPMGIGNADHAVVRDQSLQALAAAGLPAPWIYADLPYASVVPQWGTEAAARALAEHPRAGAPIRALTCSIAPCRTPLVKGEVWVAKRRAVLAYASQLAPLATDFGEVLAVPGPLTHELVWAARF